MRRFRRGRFRSGTRSFSPRRPLNVAPDSRLADFEFGGTDHAAVTQCAKFGQNLQRVALGPGYAADRLPGLISEHLALGAEDLVDSEAAIGRGDADSARHPASGG